jgi:diguanylate cyclase (GGDEF)-like protein/PAS domain S-box-containing protein
MVSAEQPVGLAALGDLQRLIARLNHPTELQQTLQSVVDGVVEGLRFGVAVVNVVRDDGRLEVVAAAGSDEARTALLGQAGERSDWDAALAAAEPWGTLRYLSHEAARAAHRLPRWVPDLPVPSDPQAWHPLDALFAPLTTSGGELVGVLSVDLPQDNRRPGPEQRHLLEMYAAQAGISIDNARLANQLRMESAALRASEEMFRLAFEDAPIGMAISDLRSGQPGRYLRVNDALCDMLGYSRKDLLARTFLDVSYPADLAEDQATLQAAIAGELSSFRGEKRYQRADGSTCWTLVSASVIRGSDGTPQRFVTQVLDITHRKQRELRLTQQALHDPLTGLPNRLLLRQRLDHAIARARRSGAQAVVLFCDLDGFKEINDAYGHGAGDQVLVTIAGRLLAEVRSVDTVARLGGDEFVVVLEDTSVPASADLVNRLQTALSSAVAYEAVSLAVTVSVGVAEVNAQTVDAEQVLQRADAAMYRAKRRSGAGPDVS